MPARVMPTVETEPLSSGRERRVVFTRAEVVWGPLGS